MLYYSFSIAHRGEAVPNSAVVVVACFRARLTVQARVELSRYCSLPHHSWCDYLRAETCLFFFLSEILTSNLPIAFPYFHILPLAYVRARALSLSLSD